MLDRIKRLGAETVVYGVMTITGRFLTFLLVPFYTNILLPGEYGIVAYLFSIIAFLTICFSYGMESAYFKYASTGEIGTPRQNFSTPFLSLLVTSVLFSSILTLFGSELAAVAGFGDTGPRLVVYAAWILCFDALALVPFAALRLQHRARLFALIKLVNIVINVTLNVIFLALLGLGVEGVFLAGLTASAITLLILLVISRKMLELSFSVVLWKQLLKFGIPYVPAGVASIALQVIDRPILRALTDDATVGIYQANYRLGIVMMLLVSTFDYAYRPFFLNNANLPDAKQLFARISTYFFIVMTMVWLIVTLFVRDVVSVQLFGRYLIHPDYWYGLNIIPVIMFAYMFNGWAILFMPGIFIQKKTQYLPLVTGVAAFVNIAANFLLIPLYGIMGAALATLFSYIVNALGMYIVSQQFYAIQYESKRLVIVSVIFLLVGSFTYFLLFYSQADVRLYQQLIIMCGFPILLLVGGILRRDEISALKRIIRRSGREKGKKGPE